MESSPLLRWAIITYPMAAHSPPQSAQDLAHAFSHMGIRTGLDLAALISAAKLACRLVNRPVSSHVGIAGPRFTDVGPDEGEAT